MSLEIHEIKTLNKFIELSTCKELKKFFKLGINEHQYKVISFSSRVRIDECNIPILTNDGIIPNKEYRNKKLLPTVYSGKF